ncbi:hypothetical protein [Nostoc sp. FACHB-888]|nr:hypothetical protein [Nostoc sp. FACHB-888]
MTYAVKGYQEIAAVMKVGFGVIALIQRFMRSLPLSSSRSNARI